MRGLLANLQFTTQFCWTQSFKVEKTLTIWKSWRFRRRRRFQRFLEPLSHLTQFSKTGSWASSVPTSASLRAKTSASQNHSCLNLRRLLNATSWKEFSRWFVAIFLCVRLKNSWTVSSTSTCLQSLPMRICLTSLSAKLSLMLWWQKNRQSAFKKLWAPVLLLCLPSAFWLALKSRLSISKPRLTATVSCLIHFTAEVNRKFYLNRWA